MFENSRDFTDDVPHFYRVYFKQGVKTADKMAIIFFSLGDKEKLNEMVQKAWIFINDR